MQPNDQQYLAKALELAKIRRGFCAPNPTVGAVIITQMGEIVATGFHLQAGAPHAEIDALAKLAGPLEQSTLYVTLEPCCHHGKTPPCTDAIIQSGIRRVVYGYKDPNPIVSGKGAEKLRAAGIECEYLMLPEVHAFYQSYQYWHETHLPFVTAKLAMTLDGKIASAKGEPIQITGREVQAFTHEERKHADALLTTAKTILQDNPKLNVRLQNEVIAKPLYVLDRMLDTPDDATIFTTAAKIILFHAEQADEKRLAKFIEQGVRCVQVPVDENGLDWSVVLQTIGADGVHDLWVEAGGRCFSSLLKQGRVQRGFIYIAPWWLGDGVDAFDGSFSLRAPKVDWVQYGKDVVGRFDLLP